MRILKIVATTAALSMLLGASAFAAERTTNSATLVDPVSHAYVATFVQDIGTSVNHKDIYLGVYLAQPFELHGQAFLSIDVGNRMAFSTSLRALEEEGWVSEVGGVSRMAFLPIGTKVYLVLHPGYSTLPTRVIAIGTIK